MSERDKMSVEPLDPDVTALDLVASLRAELPVIVAVAVGGVAGALARYGAGVAWPSSPGSFPWTTFGINVLGCGLIGVLLVIVTEVLESPHPLVRPLLGTGVLGGFTTFSTYALDVRGLIAAGRTGVAVTYLLATLAAAMAAVTAATWTTRWWARRLGERRLGERRQGDQR